MSVIFSFTAPETVGGLNGPFHSTVSLNGLRFADIFSIDDAYVIERNGHQSEPVTREVALASLDYLARGFLVHAEEQMDGALASAFENPFAL